MDNSDRQSTRRRRAHTLRGSAVRRQSVGRKPEPRPARLRTETSYVKTRRSARRVFASVERFLTRKLKLVVNQRKSRIAKADGVEFLGFKFVGRRGEIRVTAKNLTKFKQRARSITGRSRGISMQRMLGELRQYLRGWIGYFGLAATKGIFAALDGWIRRRVRMCFWKQWRLLRTRIRKLKQLGVPHDLALSMAPAAKPTGVLPRR